MEEIHDRKQVGVKAVCMKCYVWKNELKLCDVLVVVVMCCNV